MISTRITEGQERSRLRVPIPLVPEELRPAVQSLLRAAAGFRAAFARVGDGMDFEQVVTAHHAFLGLCIEVVDAWAAHLGIDFDREREEGEDANSGTTD